MNILGKEFKFKGFDVWHKGNLSKVSQLENDNEYATQTDIDNSISEIEVGGRNLILNSAEMHKPLNSIRITLVSPSRGLIEGTYTISFDYEIITNDNPVPISQLLLYSTSSITNVNIESGTTEGKAIATFNIVSEKANGGLYMYGGNGAAQGRLTDIVFKNVKLEKGNKATDWTPAPEDVDDKIDTKADKSYVDDNIPTKVSQLENDAGYTSNALRQTVSNTEPTSSNIGEVWIQIT